MTPVEAASPAIHSTAPTAVSGPYRRAHSPDQSACNDDKRSGAPDPDAADVAPLFPRIGCTVLKLTAISGAVLARKAEQVAALVRVALSAGSPRFFPGASAQPRPIYVVPFFAASAALRDQSHPPPMCPIPCGPAASRCKCRSERAPHFPTEWCEMCPLLSP